jgi:hypothetical protein
MGYKHRSELRDSRTEDKNREYLVHILAVEYQTLRQEIQDRTSGRYQFLGLTTTAAALLTTGIFGSSIFEGRIWIAAGLAIVVFTFGVVSFVYLGRMRELTIIEAAALERRINALLPAEPGFSAVLTRASNRGERRTYYWRIKLLFLGS